MSAPVTTANSRNAHGAVNGGRPLPVAANRKTAIERTEGHGMFGDQTPLDEVILATAGYDHTIRFWKAHTGQCTRTVQHTDSQVGEVSKSNVKRL